MAAVENLSEVIKDNVKEHVSTTQNESTLENDNVYNGETESKRYDFAIYLVHSFIRIANTM